MSRFSLSYRQSVLCSVWDVPVEWIDINQTRKPIREFKFGRDFMGFPQNKMEKLDYILTVKFLLRPIQSVLKCIFELPLVVVDKGVRKWHTFFWDKNGPISQWFSLTIPLTYLLFRLPLKILRYLVVRPILSPMKNFSMLWEKGKKLVKPDPKITSFGNFFRTKILATGYRAVALLSGAISVAFYVGSIAFLLAFVGPATLPIPLIGTAAVGISGALTGVGISQSVVTGIGATICAAFSLAAALETAWLSRWEPTRCWSTPLWPTPGITPRWRAPLPRPPRRDAWPTWQGSVRSATPPKRPRR